MQTYSTFVVVDSLLKSEEIDSTIEKIERNIKNNGGEIIELDRWGKKRLAYTIKKRQYGYYVEIIFKSSGDVIKIIEREYGLDENILRYLTIVLDKKALQYRQNEKDKITKRSVDQKDNSTQDTDKKDNSNQDTTKKDTDAKQQTELAVEKKTVEEEVENEAM